MTDPLDSAVAEAQALGQLPDDLCQFCYELADEMAVHNQSDVQTEYAEIHHHAHGKEAGNQ